MHIRPATSLDQESVSDLHLSAFPSDDRQAVATFAVDLLAEQSIPETFSLVAEADGAVVGHIGFSPVSQICTDNFQGYILAPLAVHPDFQKQRIGERLIDDGIQHLVKINVDIVFVYGDPRYYGRFGFDARVAADYTPPYRLQFPGGWQAKPLTDVDTFPATGKLTCVSSLRHPNLW